ncbi:flagellar assembly protein FliH [Sporolactobacillus vineae]|uniref:flagellar assembly protein FliH n=1 Tax=Sporolactobacillus vineae TaxID=444463 RepID=UPI001EE64DF6|nr:flagellar assembly protein FliH [Sporolactobacillus vineae]
MIKSPERAGQGKVVRLTTIAPPEELTDGTAKSVNQTLEERIGQARKQAAQILDAAKEQKSEIEAELQAQKEKAERAQKAAYEENRQAGYKAGFSQGLQAGKADWQKRIDQANQLVDRMRTDYQKKIAAAEPDILKLSMAVAEKILSVSIASDEDKWFSLVAKAVREVKDQKTVKIIVPPDHFATLDIHKEELDALVRNAGICIYADGDLQDHACIIETEFGRIDAGIDSQLTVIKQKLREIMEEHA